MTTYNKISHTTTGYDTIGVDAPLHGYGIMVDEQLVYVDSQDYYVDGSVVYRNILGQEPEIRCDRMSNPPTKVTLTGASESLSDGFTKVNTIIDSLLSGDGTAARLLRVSRLTIEDATQADKVKCTMASIFNGDVIAAEDNLGKGGDTGDFNLDATGSQVHIESGGLTGNATHVLVANIVDNGSGNIIYCKPSIATNGITLEFQLNDSTAYDLTSAVDTGTIIVDIIYLTIAA